MHFCARCRLELDLQFFDLAKEILIERQRCSEAEAYALLRRKAMDQGRKIADIARALVTAADLLQPGEGE